VQFKPFPLAILRRDIARIQFAADSPTFAHLAHREAGQHGRKNPIRPALGHEIGTRSGSIGQSFLGEFFTLFRWRLAKGEIDTVLDGGQNRQEQGLPIRVGAVGAHISVEHRAISLWD
jgi:hypothetical protein